MSAMLPVPLLDGSGNGKSREQRFCGRKGSVARAADRPSLRPPPARTLVESTRTGQSKRDMATPAELPVLAWSGAICGACPVGDLAAGLPPFDPPRPPWKLLLTLPFFLLLPFGKLPEPPAVSCMEPSTRPWKNPQLSGSDSCACGSGAS